MPARPMRTRGFRDGLKFVARMITGPSAEQGLLIARDHYERLGGYRPDSRRSEARLLRQLGRRSRTMLRSRIMMVACRRTPVNALVAAPNKNIENNPMHRRARLA